MLVREIGGLETARGEALEVTGRNEAALFDRRFGGGCTSCTLSSLSMSSHLDRLRDDGEGAFMVGD